MRLIYFAQLRSEKGIRFTRQHVGRLQKAGKFPRSVPLGENTKPFIEEEIDEYVASRVAERDARAARQQRQEVPAAAEPPAVGAGSARGRRKLSSAQTK
jgi:prophage regulatory protein